MGPLGVSSTKRLYGSSEVPDCVSLIAAQQGSHGFGGTHQKIFWNTHHRPFAVGSLRNKKKVAQRCRPLPGNFLDIRLQQFPDWLRRLWCPADNRPVMHPADNNQARHQFLAHLPWFPQRSLSAIPLMFQLCSIPLSTLLVISHSRKSSSHVGAYKI